MTSSVRTAPSVVVPGHRRQNLQAVIASDPSYVCLWWKPEWPLWSGEYRKRTFVHRKHRAMKITCSVEDSVTGVGIACLGLTHRVEEVAGLEVEQELRIGGAEDVGDVLGDLDVLGRLLGFPAQVVAP